MDDFLIFYSDERDLTKLRNQLSNRFQMKDLGPATHCVGIKIAQGENFIELDQSVYIIELLEKFNLAETKRYKIPSDTNTKLSIKMKIESQAEDEELEKLPYQEAVESLLYLAQCTRPDIAFAVNDVSRFNSNYGFNAVARIFGYLRNTIDLKLRFEHQKCGKVNAFSDSDYASDVDKRRSCTGYDFVMQGGAVTWNSRRQDIVAQSSTEAEYIA